VIRVIERSKLKEMVFKTLVQDYFLENPKVDKALVEIKNEKATRSTKQNRLYWMWLSQIEKDTGMPKLDYFEDSSWRKGLHTRFKCDFIEKEFYDDGAMKIPSTKKLKVKEFANYLEQIDRSMAEMGLVLPHPDDLYWEAMGIKAP
jgi:hypothetical protein